jgi:hypothetical protein
MLIPINKTKPLFFIFAIVLATVMIGCAGQSQPGPATTLQPKPEITRAQSIPTNAVKVTPESDSLPPQLHSNEFENPVPLSSVINTAGSEDAAFITPDGNKLYFFFIPDASIPWETQLHEVVIGIYVSQKLDGDWSEPERVHLQDAGEPSIDGCPFVLGNTMWFCSVRKGNYRVVDMWTAEFKEGKWTDWKNAGPQFNLKYEVEEPCITADGNEMYFHSQRAGGKGGYDIWVTKKADGKWQEPENVAAVNTPETEVLPFITQDGNELWFTRTYMGYQAILRSKKINGEWGQPELIISQSASEPSLDNQGNVYFTHYFFKDGKVIESDIYVARRK